MKLPVKHYNDTIILATANTGKVREFSNLLARWLAPGWHLIDRVSWADKSARTLADTVEDADTFEGNAAKKAVEIARATGLCALSDDSGLQVDALGGAPGVLSARYASLNGNDDEKSDVANNQKLVHELSGVSPAARTARFVSVICLALPDNEIGRELLARVGKTFDEIPSGKARTPEKEAKFVRDNDVVVVWFRGTVEGVIVDDARGDGGFGYDPHFYVPSAGKTMAEMSLEAKNAISHRAVALEKLYEFFGPPPVDQSM